MTRCAHFILKSTALKIHSFQVSVFQSSTSHDSLCSKHPVTILIAFKYYFCLIFCYGSLTRLQNNALPDVVICPLLNCCFQSHRRYFYPKTPQTYIPESIQSKCKECGCWDWLVLAWGGNGEVGETGCQHIQMSKLILIIKN